MSDFINNPVPTIQEEVIALKLKNEELEKELENQNKELIQKTSEFEKENAELKAKLNGALDICNIPEFRINDLEKENAELKKDKEWLDNINNEQTEVILELQAQIEKMKQDQKTAYIKGLRHFAKAMKEYDRTKGAWTDYFEHTVDEVLKQELAE